MLCILTMQFCIQNATHNVMSHIISESYEQRNIDLLCYWWSGLWTSFTEDRFQTFLGSCSLTQGFLCGFFLFLSVLILLLSSFMKSLLVVSSNSVRSNNDPQSEKMLNISLSELLIGKSEETIWKFLEFLFNLAAL